MSIELETFTTIDDLRKRAIKKGGRPLVQVGISANSDSGGAFQWTVSFGWYNDRKYQVEVGIHHELACAAQIALDKITPEPDLSEYTGPWKPESARAQTGGTFGT